MQNSLCPTECPSCGDFDVCHSSCICPACDGNPDAYEAWKALAPVMAALNAKGITWGWASDLVMPTPLERYSLDITLTEDKWAAVYAKDDGSFMAEHFYPVMVAGIQEIDSGILWRGKDPTECAQAIAHALWK